MSSTRLNPLPAVEVDGVRILVDKERPVAVLQSGDSSRLVTWPSAPLPPIAATARLVTAPDAVWVVYEEAAEFSPDLPECTAVRIGIDGVASGLTIGQLQVIGADSEGIWATPQAWPPAEPNPQEEDDDDAPTPKPSDYDGAGLPLESWEEFHKREELWQEEEFAERRENVLADQDASDGSNDDEDDDAENSFGWFAYAVDDEDEERAPHFEAPPAPGPSAPVELVRYRADGRSDRLKVDRTVAEVAQDGALTAITFFPTNPIARVEQDGAVLSYAYPKSRILVDFSNGLPSTLAVGEYEATALPLTDEWDDMWDDESLRDESDIPADDRVELPSTDGIDWAQAEISRENMQSALTSLVEQLEWLAKPKTIWTRRDDQVHLVESPYRDLSIDVEGDWPGTTVTVEFHHREYSDALYRRRYRVFDSSGRPIDRQYMTVYLEEDIATGDHPAERDGVIEFPDE